MPSPRRHLILHFPLLLISILCHAQQRRQDTLIFHFPFDSHHIQTDDRTRLLQSFHYPIVESVFITGYTDKTGSTAYNQRLSEDRANAVADLLTPILAKSAQRHTAGGGIAPTPQRSDSDNRRAEVVVCYIVPDSSAASTHPNSATPPNPTPPTAPAAAHYDTITRSAGRQSPARPTHPSDSIVVVKQVPVDSTATTDSAQPSAVLALRRINFIVDTPIPTDSTRRVLPQLITELRQYKDRHLEIDGYVNSLTPLHGTNDPLFKLSVNRAKFIYNCLVEAGFNPANLTYKGLGNSSPINPHPTTKQEMNANMRVEIKVF